MSASDDQQAGVAVDDTEDLEAELPYFDLPPGPELRRRNRRILAERLHWPEGALELCDDIEKKHPDWSVSWRAENTIVGFEAPAGFYADRRGHRRHLEKPLYGYSDQELVGRIKLWRPRPRD